MNNSKNDIFFSIIIPVYNTEKYLEKCIDSCLSQIFDSDSFEMVFVNDGSTDKSPDIIERIAANYQNILIIHQQNMGLSRARNNGLNIARGKYVWFVDSDDWIEEYSLEKLYEICAKFKPDIIAFGAKNYFKDHITRERSNLLVGNALIPGKLAIESNMYHTCATFYLYSKEFLQKNSLQFFPNIYHEDIEFVPRALFAAKTLFSSHLNFYCVNERVGSITRSYIPKKSDDLLLVASNLIEYFNLAEKTMPKKIISGISTRISTALNSALYNSRNQETELFRLVERISMNRLYILSFLNSRSIKHRIEGILLHSPQLFISFYKLKKTIIKR